MYPINIKNDANKEGAGAAGYSYQKEDKFINISLSYHRLMSNPVISSGIGWKF